MATGNKRRERLAVLLAGGRSVRAAARISGVAERTAYRWYTEDAEFQKRVAELRTKMTKRGVDVLSGAMVRAAAKLRKLVTSSDERVALSACRAVLELRTKLHESEDHERRLRALEAAAEAAAKQREFDPIPRGRR